MNSQEKVCINEICVFIVIILNYLQDLNKNALSQGDINIFRHFNIYIYAVESLFGDLTNQIGNDFLNRENIIKFVISRSEYVENYKTMPMSEKFDFGGYFGEKRAQTYARFFLKPRVNSRFG